MTQLRADITAIELGGARIRDIAGSLRAVTRAAERAVEDCIPSSGHADLRSRLVELSGALRTHHHDILHTLDELGRQVGISAATYESVDRDLARCAAEVIQ